MLLPARLALALLLAWTAGCAFAPAGNSGKLPLAPFKPAVEASALEVVFVRHPYELPSLNEELWSQLDETPIAPDVRQALAKNGLRVGVVAAACPQSLEAVLAAGNAAAGQPGDDAAIQPIGALDKEPLVRRRTLHASPGQRSELLASGLYERLPLLVRDGDDAGGSIYFKAQCVFAVKASPLGDGRVRLTLVPEVQHGEPRREIRGDDGVFRFEPARPKVAFDKMAFDVVLSPGQAIVLGTRTERPGSLGHYFFTEPRAGQLEQKLMLIRFDGTRYDSLLMADGGARPSGAR